MGEKCINLNCLKIKNLFTQDLGIYTRRAVHNLIKKKYKKVPVIQYSLDNVFIKEWDSKTDAEKELKICNISRAIRKNLTAGGYKWKYKI